jgi:hypothetical protein
MLPNFLLPENIARTDGAGPVVELDSETGKLLVVTLAIDRALEQESLDVSIWASPDGANWGVKPIANFPQKFYCGMYSILLNLAGRPDAKFLHVRWKVNRWARGGEVPLFGFHVFAEESGARLRTAAYA